jgi:hypothetical protein
MPQGRKARTWVMLQRHNSMITFRIDPKLGGNVSQTLSTRCVMTSRSTIRDLFKKMSLGHNTSVNQSDLLQITFVKFAY